CARAPWDAQRRAHAGRASPFVPRQARRRQRGSAAAPGSPFASLLLRAAAASGRAAASYERSSKGDAGALPALGLAGADRLVDEGAQLAPRATRRFLLLATELRLPVAEGRLLLAQLRLLVAELRLATAEL